MGVKLMQFEDITQEQWEQFVLYYIDDFMGLGSDNLTDKDLKDTSDDLKRIVKKKGISGIDGYRFEWKSQVSNVNPDTNMTLAVCNSEHSYVFLK